MKHWRDSNRRQFFFLTHQQELGVIVVAGFVIALIMNIQIVAAQITDNIDNGEVITESLKIRGTNGSIRQLAKSGTINVSSRTRFSQKIFAMKQLDARKKIFNKKGKVLIGDDLTVSGTINNVNIVDLQDAVTALQDEVITSVGSGLELSGNTLSLLSTCTSGQVLKYSGTAWACASDSDTTYTAGTGISITSGSIASSLGTTVGSEEITDGTIVKDDLADGAVTSAKIVDGTIASADIAANTITDSDVDLSGNWTVTGAWTLSGNFVNTASPWADNEVVDALTISGGTIDNTPIGATTEAAGNFSNITVYDEARLMQSRPQIPRVASTAVIGAVTSSIDSAPAVVSGLNGQPIVAYYDDSATSLIVVTCAVGNSFCSSVTTKTVDGSTTNVGRDPSMVLSKDGYPIISYYDVDNSALKIAFCSDERCSSATVTSIDGFSGCAPTNCSANDIGRGSSIAMVYDSTLGTNIPIISYVDATSTANIKVAKCNDAVDCDSPTITDITAAISSASVLITGMAISPDDGFPVIAYIDGSTDLGIINCSNVSCSSNTPGVVTATITVDDISLTIDQSGKALIAFVDSQTPTDDIRMVECDPDSCTSQTPSDVLNDTAATFISITLGVDGLPVFAFENSGAGSELKVVRCSTVNCASANLINVTAESGRVNNLSIALHSDGTPIIIYENSDDLQIQLYKAPNIYLTPGLTLR